MNEQRVNGFDVAEQSELDQLVPGVGEDDHSNPAPRSKCREEIVCHHDPHCPQRWWLKQKAAEAPKTEIPPRNYLESVNHPPHYTAHPSGVECIDVVEHMPFNVGNAVKYLWRCGLKGNEIEDLKKARWYIDREIEKRSRAVEPDEER